MLAKNSSVRSAQNFATLLGTTIDEEGKQQSGETEDLPRKKLTQLKGNTSRDQS